MYILVNKNGNAIFNGLTPNIRPIWRQLEDIAKDDVACFQIYLYKNTESEIQQLSRMGIEVVAKPISELIAFLDKGN